MNIYDFIVDASNEFEINGRSAKFIAMENKMLKSKNIITQYFFARYAKGASVAKFQEIVLEMGAMEDGFYFCLFVPGADVKPFLNKAIYNGDEFWIGKFIEVGEKLGQIVRSNVNKRLKDSRNINLEKLGQFNADTILEKANIEYKNNGRSDLFVEQEKALLHAIGNGHLLLLATNVKGVDLRQVERSAIMRGDSFVMYALVRNVDNIDKRLMLNACRMARLDYLAIEKDGKEVEEEIEAIRNRLKQCRNFEERAGLNTRLNMLLDKYTYKNRVDRHIMGIESMIARDRLKK